ncbi:DNA mismatch repair protein, partial [Halomonas marinisediminis]
KQIDDFYLNNLTINEQLVGLNETIAWYRNISLFLQVFGLALILARDLEGIPVAK